MEKVFVAYASKKGVAPNSLRFLLDGDRIKGDQTPDDLDLQDGDQVDAVLEQVGGFETK
jgi:small ubiquitin-related modifier